MCSCPPLTKIERSVLTTRTNRNSTTSQTRNSGVSLPPGQHLLSIPSLSTAPAPERLVSPPYSLHAAPHTICFVCLGAAMVPALSGPGAPSGGDLSLQPSLVSQSPCCGCLPGLSRYWVSKALSSPKCHGLAAKLTCTVRRDIQVAAAEAGMTADQLRAMRSSYDRFEHMRPCGVALQMFECMRSCGAGRRS